MSQIAELLERFRRGPELVAVATTGVAGAQLDFAPGPGKWSIRQIVCHLADAELVGAVRFRRVIAEDDPVLQAFDQDAWTSRLHYEKRRFSPALETFRRLRTENYELLKDLPEEAFSRTGRHTEAGPLTLLDLVRLYAEHAENHARQILEIRRLYKERKAAGELPG
jgi:hypothetical protein